MAQSSPAQNEVVPADFLALICVFKPSLCRCFNTAVKKGKDKIPAFRNKVQSKPGLCCPSRHNRCSATWPNRPKRPPGQTGQNECQKIVWPGAKFPWRPTLPILLKTIILSCRGSGTLVSHRILTFRKDFEFIRKFVVNGRCLPQTYAAAGCLEKADENRSIRQAPKS